MKLNTHFDPIIELAKSVYKSRGTVKLGIMATESDLPQLKGISDLVNKNWIKPILYGNESVVRMIKQQLGGEEAKYEYRISPDTPQMSEMDAYFDQLQTVSALTIAQQQGEIDMLLLGWSVREAILPLLLKPGGNKQKKSLTPAGVSVISIPKYERLLFVADTRLHPEPTIEERVEISKSAVYLAKCCGVASPKVALLAAVEVPTPGIPVTVECEKVAEILTEQGIEAAGPLSMDLAVSAYAAEKKKAKSPVAGHADILVGSTLTVSKGIYQATSAWCDAQVGTVLLGREFPIAAPGKLDGEAGGYLSVLLATLQLNPPEL
ncbi:hypothetical protein K8I28_04735 [bacterium]|nr:hypothetical protein [bacterium]